MRSGNRPGGSPEETEDVKAVKPPIRRTASGVSLTAPEHRRTADPSATDERCAKLWPISQHA